MRSGTDPTSSPFYVCKRGDVLCATNPSPWRPVGTTITSDGGYSAAVTNSITAFFSILLATNRSTALTIPVHRCVLYGAFEMLERLAEKLARAVLRGGGGGNVASLPDPRTDKNKMDLVD